jgi:rare lipoprotein A
MKRNLIAFLSIGLFLLATQAKTQDFTQVGMASFYADKFEGRTTANGEKYRHAKLTAAHRTLQFGTKVKVTNLSNQKTVVVVINDRGPFVDGRIIDLSKSGAEKLDFVHQGLAEVKLEIVDAAATNTSRGTMSQVPQSDVGNNEKLYYEVSAKKRTPQGYGVQIGSFEEMSNLIKLADELSANSGDKVIVKVSYINSRKLYQVLVGQENTHKKADKLRTKLTKKYPKCFVVKF